VSGSDLSTCSFRLYPATPGRDPTSAGVFFSTTIAQPPRGSVDRGLDRSGIRCRSFAWRMNLGATDFGSQDTARTRLLVLNNCCVGGARGDLLHSRFSFVDAPDSHGSTVFGRTLRKFPSKSRSGATLASRTNFSCLWGWSSPDLEVAYLPSLLISFCHQDPGLLTWSNVEPLYARW